MRILLLTLLTLFSVSALAVPGDSSEELVTFLEKNHVFSNQKSLSQELSISCKRLRNSDEDTGKICVIRNCDGLLSVLGDRARELSKILTRFKIRREGSNDIQFADVRCELVADASCEILHR